MALAAVTGGRTQTPSTDWFTTSFLQGGRCQKAVLGVCSVGWWSLACCSPSHGRRYRSMALVAVTGGRTPTPSTGLRHPSFFPSRRKVPESGKRCLECGSNSNSKHWFTTSFLLSFKEEGAGKRYLECGSNTNSKHWFTTSFLQPLPYLDAP